VWGPNREIGVDLSRAEFRKSSFSGANGCVEVAVVGGLVGVRDSKQVGRDRPEPPVLWFAAEEWEAFLRSARAGEFDPDR
jgi:Domain of unknown function (DUF397)